MSQPVIIHARIRLPYASTAQLQWLIRRALEHDRFWREQQLQWELHFTRTRGREDANVQHG